MTTATLSSKTTILAISELSTLHPEPTDLQASSLTDLSRDAARAYALRYTGTNEFLQAIRAKLTSVPNLQLTDNQARWVLINAIKNYRAWLATTTDTPPAGQPAPQAVLGSPVLNLKALQPGVYTVLLADHHLTIKVKPIANLKPGDDRYARVSYLYGPENTSDYRAFAYVKQDGHVQFWTKQLAGEPDLLSSLRKAIELLSTNDPATVLQSAFCRVCGRLLTVPTSIYDGRGPECAKKNG